MSQSIPEQVRVLHIGGNTRVNGISSMIMETYRRIDRSRFQFHFYNSSRTRGYHEDEIQILGGQVHRGYSKYRGFARAVDQMWRLSRIMSHHGPFDVVHSHYFSMNGPYLLVAWIHRVPVRISHCHQAGPVDMNWSKRFLVQFSRLLVAVCATDRLGCAAAACRFLYGRRASETLLYGIDLARFKPTGHPPEEARRKYQFDAQQKHVVFIGRLEPQKNVGFLIEALAGVLCRRRDMRLVVVGSGTMADSLVELARSLGVQDQVLFIPGPVETSSLLSVTDLFVLPSRWEGLPFVLLEAQAMGVSCLVSDRVTKDADMGLCSFLPLDPARWSSMVEVVLGENRPKIPRFDARFDIEHVVGRLTDLYSRRAGSGHAAR